jgi:hypothetical protein
MLIMKAQEAIVRSPESINVGLVMMSRTKGKRRISNAPGHGSSPVITL